MAKRTENGYGKRLQLGMPKYEFLVEVQVQYLADQSSPDEDQYVFAYTVTITNVGDIAAQLISRTWSISDARGHTEQVKGLGVVGQQPLLKPTQSFEYTSATRIRTPTGTMLGSFFCVAHDGEKFDALISMFVLDAHSMDQNLAKSRTIH